MEIFSKIPNRNKMSGKSRRERERERNKKKKEEKGRDRKEFTQSLQTDGTFTRAIITYRFERNACERERERDIIRAVRDCTVSNDAFMNN